MSNIESNIIDPAGRGQPSPDVVPVIDDPSDGLVGSDDVREPADDIPAIEPDPEEGGRTLPDIHRG